MPCWKLHHSTRLLWDQRSWEQLQLVFQSQSMSFCCFEMQRSQPGVVKNPHFVEMWGDHCRSIHSCILCSARRMEPCACWNLSCWVGKSLISAAFLCQTFTSSHLIFFFTLHLGYLGPFKYIMCSKSTFFFRWMLSELHPVPFQACAIWNYLGLRCQKATVSVISGSGNQSRILSCWLTLCWYPKDRSRLGSFLGLKPLAGAVWKPGSQFQHHSDFQLPTRYISVHLGTSRYMFHTTAAELIWWAETACAHPGMGGTGQWILRCIWKRCVAA